MGTEVQVLYPTLFLMEATERPEVATALRRSYNRWLADRCAESHGRLRWVCLPPRSTRWWSRTLRRARSGLDRKPR